MKFLRHDSRPWKNFSLADFQFLKYCYIYNNIITITIEMFIAKSFLNEK